MFTKPFSKISKYDAAIAGGKGASLGEMTQASISVPPGFVVLSGAFERFIEETDLNVEIDAKLHKVDHNAMHTVEEASEKIQALILQTKMPQDIADEIQKEFKKLGAKYVAVRSSATAEDSSSAAWAGQLDSFLNTTDENLLENVRKCWASLFTPRAIFYRFEQNLHKQKISVAVVVQKMVESEKSGIAFSVHPVTQDRNQLIIEAGLGLGEAVVSGSITPDGYVVEKEPRRIIDKNINTQEKMLTRAESGGNEWQDIPKEKGKRSVLDDGQIMELTDLILKIENHYGFPCDIEWAFEKGEFYIMQSRPITTLLDKKSQKIKLDWANLFEVPFRFAIYLELGIKIFAKDNHYKKLPGCKNNFVILYQHDGGVTEYHLREELEKAGKWGLLAHQDTEAMQKYIDDGDSLLTRIQVFFKKTSSVKLDLCSLTDLKRIFRELADLFEESLAYYKLCNDEFQVDVSKKIEEWFQDNGIADTDLIQELATPHRLTTLDLIDIEILKAAKLLKEKNKKNDFKKIANNLSGQYGSIGGGAEGGREWDKDYFEHEILQKAEELNVSEIEKEITEKKQKGNDVLNQKKQIKDDIGLPSDLWRLTQQMASLAHLKFEIRISWAYLDTITEKLLRSISLIVNIPYTQLIYLNTDEIGTLLKNTKDSIFKIKDRKHAMFYMIKHSKYSVYYGDTAISQFHQEVSESKYDDSGVIKGQVASQGKVTGPARVVSPLKDQEKELAKVQEGDIIVTGMTRPHMIPAMKKAIAFVTDEGGITCHAAIIAREMHKPCVIATRNATKIIHDGDMLEIDAFDGIVRIIK